MLNKDSIEGLNIQKRISDVVNMGHQASVVYEQKNIKSEEINKASKEADKPIVFNKNIQRFNPEQQKYVSDNLKDFMQTFGYCSKLAEGEQPDYVTSDEWHKEQQTKYNFAKYADIEEEKYYSFLGMNKMSLYEVVKAEKEGTLKDRVYVVNSNKNSDQLAIPKYPDFTRLSMKEKP